MADFQGEMSIYYCPPAHTTFLLKRFHLSNSTNQDILLFFHDLLMNEKLYASALSSYKKWVDNNKAEAKSELNERHALCDEMQSYTKERLQNLTEDEFFNLIAPLWAMGMWGNKRYYLDNVIENNGMDLLRAQLVNLFYGSTSIENRWDEFREKVKGMGPAFISELLNKFKPEEYILWNKKSLAGFTALGIPKVPKNSSALDGKKYAYLSEVGRELVASAQKQGFSEIEDLLALNYFIWQELQIEPIDKEVAVEDKPEKETEQQKTFVHNDVRDRIRDIGSFLGFKAEIEKKIADGAVVDALWEVSVGNMGRITYVFEVQTSGSIDSLLLNLMKAKNNPSVQGIVAVSDSKQIEKIKKEAASLREIRDELKFWDYNDVLKVFDSLSNAYESINALGLVPSGLF